MACLAEIPATSPIRRGWLLDEEFTGYNKPMLTFRLVYQGVLLASANRKPHSEHKHDIRRYLHRQLVNVWKTKEPLKARSGFRSTPHDKSIHQRVVWSGGETDQDQLVETFGTRKFLPIVSDNLALTCKLDILILSRDHSAIISTGDLDGRLKTILDALRFPKVNEYAEGDEDPLFCLMTEDNLISEIHLTGDILMAEPDQVVDSPRQNIYGEEVTSKNHALVLIDVAVKPTRIMTGNLDFA